MKLNSNYIQHERLMRKTRQELVERLARRMWCLRGKRGKVADMARMVEDMSKRELADSLYRGDF
jgi:hypothetical protein